MVDSVNNTAGALGALKQLQIARREQSQSETRISSGVAIASPKDDPAAYQTAASMRGEIGGLKAASLSLGRAQSIADTGIAAAEQVSTLLLQMRERAASAINNDLSADQRDAFNAEFSAMKASLDAFIANASFDGANLIDGSQPAGVRFIADADGQQTVTLTGRDFRAGHGVVTLTPDQDLSTPERALAAYESLGVSITNVGSQLAAMVGEGRRIETQVGFISRLADVLAAGVGRLVDADLAIDSALIQALQVKQSLSAEALGIANSAPRSLLQLFRS
ncbi:flagellin [bacterium]|nr:flagellin [bacterium]